MDKLYLSTVTPVYQGALFLPTLVAAIDTIRSHWTATRAPVELIEALFIVDGAVDESEQVLLRLRDTHPWIRLIVLSRNFGQHPATVAGVLHTSGDWVATFDEDLQHHPKHLTSLLLHAARCSADIVYASPTSTVHQSLWRDLSSRTLKSLLSVASGNPHVREFNSFRMMRGTVARAAAAAVGHETYYDVALSWFTSRVSTLTLPMKDHRYITTRRSGYHLRSLLHHARRLLVSSEVKGLRTGALLGALALLASIALGATALAAKLFFPETVALQGWTSLMVAILFFSGLTALLLGILLEYQSVLFLHIHGKPVFFVVDRSTDALLLAMADIGDLQACCS